MPFGRLLAPLPVQCMAVAGLLVALALRAPTDGTMMVVPLGSAGSAALVNRIVEAGGLLVGTGPLGGSLIVYGRRAALEPALWRAGAIVIAAPRSACGTPS